jgi:glycosyltransferase involved in cell wall biosynthesis
MDLTVYYLSDHGRRAGFDQQFGQTFQWDIPLDEGYKWELLPGAVGTCPGSRQHRWNFSPARKVYENVADVFMRSDYDSAGAVAFFYNCLARGIPILYRGETTLLHENPRRAAIKRRILGPVFRRIVHVLAIGKLTYEYALSFMIPPERIIYSPYNVDDIYWGNAACKWLPLRADLLRDFGLSPDRPVILFCGKVIEKKRPLDLARAVCLLARNRPVSLLVAGTGDQFEEMKRVVSTCPAVSAYFAGFVNQSKLPRLYAASDIICLPSSGTETWGLVVNEAMYFGCVPVVSERVGCALDLVEGIGEIHSVGNAAGIASSIEKVLGDIEARRQRIPARIAQYSLRRAVDGIVAGALRATGLLEKKRISQSPC